MPFSIDINCDLGESFGTFQKGQDAAVFPFLTSCNIACGFHGGDPWHMEQTIQLALQHQVRIGAHPSYPDLQGFGRRSMQIPAPELKAMIKYQIAALKGMAESQGGTLTYVKPHGALYNDAAKDAALAATILQAIQELDASLSLMGLAGSEMQHQAQSKGHPFLAEAFADRRYRKDGRLQSRQEKGAVLHDPEKVCEQVLQIVTRQGVETVEGDWLPILADSICIHGDNPAAIEILQALDKAFEKYQIKKTRKK